MTVAMSLIRGSSDLRMALAVELQGVEDILVGLDFPVEVADVGRPLRVVLGLRDVVPKSGTVDPFKGIASTSSIRVDVVDPSGWFRGLLVRGVEAELTEPVTRTSTTFVVDSTDGFPDDGVFHFGPERIEYSSKTATDLNVSDRNTYSDGYAERADTIPGVGFPPHRIGLTPWRLEGRYIKIKGIPLNDQGHPYSTAWADALELWSGTITGVPVSVDGLTSKIQAQDPTRQLNGALPVAEAQARLLTSTILQPQFGSDGDDPMDWSGEGQGSAAGTGSALFYGARWWIGTGNNALRYRFQRWNTDSPDMDSGGREIRIPIGFYGEELLTVIQDLLRADFSAAGVLGAELQVNAKMVGGALGFPLMEVVIDYTLGVGAGVATLHLNATGDSILRTLGWIVQDVDTFQYTVGVINSYVVIKGTVGGRAYHMSAWASAMPVVFQGLLVDWTGPGFARVTPETSGENTKPEDGEVVRYTSIETTGILTPEGQEIYELRGCTRGLAGTKAEAIYLNWISVSTVPPDRSVESVYVIDTSDVFTAVGQLLTGIGEVGVNGPFSASNGLGLYASQVDTDELERLANLPTVSGPRRQVLTSSAQVSEWISHNLTAEGYILTPGWVDTSYRLTVRRLGIPGPGSGLFAGTVNYTRPVNADGGLSFVVNVINWQTQGGKVNALDLPSIKTLRITQPKTIKVGVPATVEGLLFLNDAAGRLFSLFGRPADRVEAAFQPQARGLLPGDFIAMTLGKSGLSGVWLVLTAAPCWVPGQEAQRILLQQLPDVVAGWYAPSAMVKTVVDGTHLELEPAEFSSGPSKIDPLLDGRDIHYFYPLADVYAFPDADHSAGVSATVSAVDWDTNVLTVDATAGISPGWIVRYSTRPDTNIAVRRDFIFVAPPGTIYHQWTD